MLSLALWFVFVGVLLLMEVTIQSAPEPVGVNEGDCSVGRVVVLVEVLISMASSIVVEKACSVTKIK